VFLTVEEKRVEIAVWFSCIKHGAFHGEGVYFALASKGVDGIDVVKLPLSVVFPSFFEKVKNFGLEEVSPNGNPVAWGFFGFGLFDDSVHTKLASFFGAIDNPIATDVFVFFADNEVVGRFLFVGLYELVGDALWVKNNIIGIGNNKRFVVYPRFEEEKGVPCSFHLLLTNESDIEVSWADAFSLLLFVFFFKDTFQFYFPVKVVFKHFFSSTGDDNHIGDRSLFKFIEDTVEECFVIKGKHLFGKRFGNGQKSTTISRCNDNTFHGLLRCCSGFSIGGMGGKVNR